MLRSSWFTAIVIGVVQWTRWIWGCSARRTLWRAAILGVVAWICFRHVVRPFRVDGASMEPTVPNGAIGIGWMGAYRWREPQVGEIVMIRLAGDRVLYLKRVLAKPGDLVEFRNGQLWVNGHPRPEPYVQWKWDWNSAPVRLGPDEYLVMGDRRDMPRSSHTGGIVRRERIAGKLLWWLGT